MMSALKISHDCLFSNMMMEMLMIPAERHILLFTPINEIRVSETAGES